MSNGHSGALLAMTGRLSGKIGSKACLCALDRIVLQTGHPVFKGFCNDGMHMLLLQVMTLHCMCRDGVCISIRDLQASHQWDKLTGSRQEKGNISHFWGLNPGLTAQLASHENGTHEK